MPHSRQETVTSSACDTPVHSMSMRIKTNGEVFIFYDTTQYRSTQEGRMLPRELHSDWQTGLK